MKKNLGEALLQASLQSDTDEVLRLLNAGAPLNFTNDIGKTALHCAAHADAVQVATLLISKGADVHAKDKVGNTPLHCAAMSGGPDSILFLLSKGADANAKNDMGNTPLHCATIGNSPAGLATFLRKFEMWDGKNLASFPDDDGRGPQSADHIIAVTSAKDSYSKAVVALLENGADPNAVNEEGKTPLTMAMTPMDTKQP